MNLLPSKLSPAIVSTIFASRFANNFRKMGRVKGFWSPRDYNILVRETREHAVALSDPKFVPTGGIVGYRKPDREISLAAIRDTYEEFIRGKAGRVRGPRRGVLISRPSFRGSFTRLAPALASASTSVGFSAELVNGELELCRIPFTWKFERKFIASDEVFEH